MIDLPHRYSARAEAGTEGEIRIGSPKLTELVTAAPAEFGGPGDRWSPETLLVASVADCFVLTFRAVAKASKLEWRELRCDVEGVLDKAEGGMRFTAFHVRAVLHVPPGSDEKRARRVLEKAERGCLITNSLVAESQLAAEVREGG